MEAFVIDGENFFQNAVKGAHLRQQGQCLFMGFFRVAHEQNRPDEIFVKQGSG